MKDVRRAAKRVLEARDKGSEDRRALPGYASFEAGDRPRWWTDAIPQADWGEVLGVHENEGGRQAGATVVAEHGLAVLGESGQSIWVPYKDVVGWQRLSKSPVSRSVTIETRSGNRVQIPFERGGAFAFVQFLIRATTSVG